MNTKLRIFFILLTLLQTSTGSPPWWVNFTIGPQPEIIDILTTSSPLPWWCQHIQSPWCLYPTIPTPTPTPSPSSSSCKCGVSQGDRTRIVGGQPATKNEYPWLVALVRTGSTIPFCGGTLISSKTVLTAAHCIVYRNSKIMVHVGEHDVTSVDGEQKIGVRKQTRHPEYNNRTLDNDFAVIELWTPVTFTNSTMPICLPNVGANYDDKLSTTVGWGTFSSGSYSSPSTPYEVDVDSITNTACTTNTVYKPGRITSNMICAEESGKDACQGDSGGPLMTKEKGRNFFYLIGVVSWGIGCAQSNAPGVYARVTSQIGWIKNQIEGNTCPKP